MKYIILFFIFFLQSSILQTSFAQSKDSNSTSIFYQDIKKDIALPKKVKGSIVQLIANGLETAVITTRGIYYYDRDHWKNFPENNDIITATLDSKNKIWLANKNEVFDENGLVLLNCSDLLRSDSIQCLLWDNQSTLYIGTTIGLLTYNNQNTEIHPKIKNRKVTDIASGQNNEIWVTTLQGLWTINDQIAINLDDMLMADGYQEKYYSITSTKQGQEMVFGSLYSLGGIAADGYHWAWTGDDGLPYGPIKVIKKNKDQFWLGTDKGAIKKDSTWHYYHGKRWLPSHKVVDILPQNDTAVWIATPTGISEIIQIPMTLEAKANHYEAIIEKRHNRRGIINRSHLLVPGDITSSVLENQDNDGLWTATYLIAECYRYAVTGDLIAKENAIRTYEALERLETVTGIPGYPARSYASIDDTVIQSRSPHAKKWHISPDGQWRWLDDTSSDEITGHLYSISLFCELVANSAQKQKAIALMERIVDHIIDHDYQLIDADGKPTRWGIWHPDSLNLSPNWGYERGLNSLQILSFLKTAYHYTGNEKYERSYDYLIEKHGYADNALRAKVYGPFQVSHSDDILNFLPYYGLIQYAKDDDYWPLYVKSLERSWAAVSSDRMPVWNVLSSSLLNKDCDLHIALEELQQYPLDLIDWNMKNSHRWDLRKSYVTDRFGKPQATQAIPAPENQIFRWNTNPKQMDSGYGAKREVSGTYYLVAYWMGRYYGYFK